MNYCCFQQRFNFQLFMTLNTAFAYMLGHASSMQHCSSRIPKGGTNPPPQPENPPPPAAAARVQAGAELSGGSTPDLLSPPPPPPRMQVFCSNFHSWYRQTD